MKLFKRKVLKSKRYALENGLFKKLNHIYEGIPSGQCSHCNTCCSEDVNVNYIEFLNIYNYLKVNNLYEHNKKRILRYYLTKLYQNGHCPFMQKGNCMIYPVRPLPCRIFGHLSKTEYERNYALVNKENREAKRYLKTKYGIELPEEVVNYKIPYCDKFTKDNDMTLEKSRDLSNSIFEIDTIFLSKSLLNPEFLNTSLAGWFAYSELGKEKAIKLRLELTKGK